MSYPFCGQATLDDGECVGFGLWQLVVDKFQTIVCLDTLEGERRRKEPDGMLQEVDGVAWVYPGYSRLYLILVAQSTMSYWYAARFQCLTSSCPDLTRGIRVVIQTDAVCVASWLWLGQSSPT